MRFFRREKKQLSKIAEITKILQNSIFQGLSYEQNAVEGYLRNSTVFRCINLIAQGSSAIPWILYKENNGEVEEVDEHPANKFLDKANPKQSFNKFIEVLISHLFLSGNAYILAVGPEKKPPTELYLLRPDCVSLKIERGEVVEYNYSSQAGNFIYPPERILHLKFFSPLDDYLGASPISPLALFVDHKNEGMKWNLSLLLRGARPSGALISQQSLTDDQRKHLQAIINEYSGPEGAGRILLLTGAFDWKEIGLSNKDLDWLQAIKLDTREIALTLGVPPQLIGDSENLTYSNYQEARRSLYQETILPLMKYIVSEFNYWLLGSLYKDDTLYFEMDLDEIEALRENRKDLWEQGINGFKAGVLTINEARELLGYGKFNSREADMLYLPLTVYPISESQGKMGRKSFYLSEDKIIQNWERKNRSIWQPFEKRWITELKKVFNEQEEDVLKSLGVKQVAFDMAKWNKRLAQIAIPLLNNIAEEGFKDAMGDLGINVNYEQHRSKVLEWVEKEAGTQIKGINETTLSNVRSAIEEGINNGEDMKQIAKRVKGVFDEASDVRAKMIARTETIRGYRKGNLVLYDASGVKVGQWWTALDERTCEECMGLHGKEFPIEEASSLNESIHPQCRCVILPVLEGQKNVL